MSSGKCHLSAAVIRSASFILLLSLVALQYYIAVHVAQRNTELREVNAAKYVRGAVDDNATLDSGLSDVEQKAASAQAVTPPEDFTRRIKTETPNISTPVALRRASDPEPASWDANFTAQTRVILLWNQFYGRSDFYLGSFGRRPFASCPVNDCATTDAKKLVARADALVTHMIDPISPPLPAHRPPHQQYIFFLLEPPPLSSAHYSLPEFDGVFNATMTYRPDSDIAAPFISVAKGKETTPLPPVNKRRIPVAWIVTNCNTASGREQYVGQLKQYVHVNVYGKCGKLKCHAERSSRKRMDCYKQIARDYYFYLALENSRCRHYITEKPGLALRQGMVPVVLGPSRAEYERVLPPHSFIHVEDFAGARQLAEYLHYLIRNRTAYMEYFQWRSHYQVTINEDKWCRLCEYLHRPPAAPHWYPDMDKWWRTDAHCKPPIFVDAER